MNWKIFFAVLIFLYCLYYLSSLESWHFIDYVNLVIHEAGHVLFMLFGEFLSIAGGTLLQLTVPIVFLIYFLAKVQYFSASVMMSWLGINFFNISVYAGDALKMQLPLLIGDKESHDWNQMLFSLGMLKQTELISHIFLGIGIVCVILAFCLGIYFALKNNQNNLA